MLSFSDLKFQTKRPDLMHWLVNIAVASFFSYYIYGIIARLATGTCVTLLIALLFRNTSITLVFLLRRPSKLTSRNVGDWIAAIGGTFITYLYTSSAKPIGPFIVPTAYVAMVVTAFLSTICIINLGRSFGIVPANRGVKTELLYGIVRHPLYSLYTVYDLAVISLAFSSHNCYIAILHALFSYLRAKREENILMLDRTYKEYVSKTRYMFLPGVL
jgi:protein-S-isoprenylcysteine O-methyltransferase Ste14